MKRLVRHISVFLLLCLLPGVSAAWGDEPAEQWREDLPEQVDELLEEGDRPAHQIWNDGISGLWTEITGHLGQVFREGLQGLVLVMAAVLLCAIARDCIHPKGSGSLDIVSGTGALVVTLAAAGNLKSLIGLGWETIEQLNVFSKALLPALSAAAAVSGGMTSAGVKQVAAIFFADLMITLIRQLLLPLVYCYIAAACADAMLSQPQLGRLGEGIRKIQLYLLTGALFLFTGYLSISGVLTGSVDRLTLQLTKTAIGTAFPVVGSILSNASESLLVGAGMVKNTIGVAGLLGVLAIVLLPVVRLGVQYVLYKAAGFLADTVASPPLARLISSLGSAFGLVLAMTGTCALLLMISVGSLLSVVTT